MQRFRARHRHSLDRSFYRELCGKVDRLSLIQRFGDVPGIGCSFPSVTEAVPS
jgi:hypothetical protein